MANVVTWPEVLARLIAHRDLDAAQARGAVESILTGEATSAQIAGFLVGLRAKGERPEELAAMLEAVRGASVAVVLPEAVRRAAVDVVGTGGDGASSINISTTASLVAAGAGVPVCKHGNRASSSQCGAADVLEALGVALDLSPEAVARCVAEAGIGFCFAPRFHPAFRHAGPTRRELGVPTAFNLLGPLANPAGVTRMLVGAASPEVAARLADTLAVSGVDRAWVVHGPDGLDELSTGGMNQVWSLDDGVITPLQVDGRSLGLSVATLDDLRGGDPAHNAEAVRRLLDGERGPRRDVVVLNAAATLLVAGVVADLQQGLATAADVIDTGKAAAALQRLVTSSQAEATERVE